MSTISTVYAESYTRDQLLRYSIDLKPYFNWWSIIRFSVTYGLYIFLTNKMFSIFFWLIFYNPPTEEVVGDISSSVTSSSIEIVETNIATDNILLLLLSIVLFIGFLGFLAYLPIRVFKLTYNFIPMFKTYSYNRKLPITRMKYKQIKQLSNNLENFHIFYYKYSYRDIDRYGFDYEGDDICGNLFSYFMLMCAYYNYSIKTTISNFLSKFGCNSFINKKEKNDFITKVNQHTEKVLNNILEDVEAIRKQSINEIQDARNIVERVGKK